MRKQFGSIAALTLAVTLGMTMLAPVYAAKEEPVTVRTNIGSEPDSLDPWLSAASDTEAILHNVFEGLVLYDNTGAILPGLAESWEISDDKLTYTFHLRDDVTFHNGKKMTSEDVLYTYEKLSGLGGGEPLSSKFAVITSLEAPDSTTIEMTIEKPDSSFLQFTRIAVLPKGYDGQATAPVGTGPFCFESYTPGQEIVLVRNEDYYEESRAAKIDRAEIKIMTDEGGVLTAMQSGQLDLATVYADNAEYLDGDFTVDSSPQNMVQLFAMNHTVEPFDDIRVRQAFCYALNRQEIIDGVFAGYATPIYSNFSPMMSVFYNDELEEYYPHDVDKALELMKEAGYPDGFEIRITVPSNYQKHVDTALVMIEQLKKIHVKAKLDPVDWGTWLEKVYTNFDYETTIVGLTGKLDPSEILYRYTTGYKRNFFGYSDEEFDKVIDAAKTGTYEESVDYYKEAQKILTEDAAAVYLTDPHAIVISRSDLKGYTFYPVTFLDLSSLYYEDEGTVSK